MLTAKTISYLCIFIGASDEAEAPSTERFRDFQETVRFKRICRPSKILNLFWWSAGTNTGCCCRKIYKHFGVGDTDSFRGMGAWRNSTET